MTEPQLRLARPEDDPAICEVIAAAFPDNVKARPEILRWQYRDNPFGEARSWVFEDAGRLVAHYTNYPVPVLLEGERAVAGVAVDAAVIPDYQGRRLFKPLSRALYEDSGRHGMPVSLAYPSNPVAVRGIVSAGWVEVARLATYVLPIDDAWVARRFHVPRPVASGLRRAAFGTRGPDTGDEVKGPPDGLDDLWRLLEPRMRCGIVRDGAWWEWRYAGHPHAPYRYWEVRDAGRLTGAAATTTREDFGGRFTYVLELLAADRDAARALTRAIARECGDTAGMALVARDGDWLAGIATDAGMRRLPRRLEPKPLFFGIVDNLGERPDLATAPWSVAWGDLDHF